MITVGADFFSSRTVAAQTVARATNNSTVAVETRRAIVPGWVGPQTRARRRRSKTEEVHRSVSRSKGQGQIRDLANGQLRYHNHSLLQILYRQCTTMNQRQISRAFRSFYGLGFTSRQKFGSTSERGLPIMVFSSSSISADLKQKHQNDSLKAPRWPIRAHAPCGRSPLSPGQLTASRLRGATIASRQKPQIRSVRNPH